MKKVTLFILLLVAATSSFASKPVEDNFKNPLFEDHGADPWAIFHQGKYYYMHTMQNQLVLWETEDITDVRNATKKVIFQEGKHTPLRHYWAPEIHNIDNKWYIYFTAQDGRTGRDKRIYVLENPNPDPMQGEFKMKGRITTDSGDHWAIDGSVFEYQGDLFMVWSGWDSMAPASPKIQNIYITKMINPWTSTQERICISTPNLPWEREYRNDANSRAPHGVIYVNEGPQPLFSPDGEYLHVIYSGSACWTRHYKLGGLTLKVGEDALNPYNWEKSPLPMFSENTKDHIYGTGHNSFFISPDGSEHYLLYHAREEVEDPQGAGDTRTPRIQKFEWVDGYPVFGEAISPKVSLPKPSGTKALLTK